MQAPHPAHDILLSYPAWFASECSLQGNWISITALQLFYILLGNQSVEAKLSQAAIIVLNTLVSEDQY